MLNINPSHLQPLISYLFLKECIDHFSYIRRWEVCDKNINRFTNSLFSIFWDQGGYHKNMSRNRLQQIALGIVPTTNNDIELMKEIGLLDKDGYWIPFLWINMYAFPRYEIFENGLKLIVGDEHWNIGQEYVDYYTKAYLD